MKHRLTKTIIGNAWSRMLGRCYCKTNLKFPRYGGRGITVCEFLRTSPANLLMLIGERPSPQLSIGRIDNDGHYSCGSCAECFQREWPLNIRWETAKQQARNRRTTHLFTIDGVTKSIAEWAEITGIAYFNFHHRVTHGLDPFVSHKK